MQATEVRLQRLADEVKAVRLQSDYQAAMQARLFSDQLRQKEAEVEELKVLPHGPMWAHVTLEKDVGCRHSCVVYVLDSVVD